MSKVIIFTDGACSGNPGAGGWGVIIITDELETYSGSEEKTTNNRMELKAAIMGISKSDASTKIILYTDSKYVKDGITKWLRNWKIKNWLTASKTPVKNKDLWEQLDALNSFHDVTWRWVKAHDGHRENEIADMLANKGIDNI